MYDFFAKQEEKLWWWCTLRMLWPRFLRERETDLGRYFLPKRHFGDDVWPIRPYAHCNTLGASGKRREKLCGAKKLCSIQKPSRRRRTTDSKEDIS